MCTHLQTLDDPNPVPYYLVFNGLTVLIFTLCQKPLFLHMLAFTTFWFSVFPQDFSKVPENFYLEGNFVCDIKLLEHLVPCSKLNSIVECPLINKVTIFFLFQ